MFDKDAAEFASFHRSSRKKDTAPSCAGFPAKGRAVLVCGVLQRTRSSQKATALAAATFSESTPWDMGMHTV